MFDRFLHFVDVLICFTEMIVVVVVVVSQSNVKQLVLATNTYTLIKLFATNIVSISIVGNKVGVMTTMMRADNHRVKHLKSVVLEKGLEGHFNFRSRFFVLIQINRNPFPPLLRLR